MSNDKFGGAEFPTLVPTLSPAEVRFLLNMVDPSQSDYVGVDPGHLAPSHDQHPWSIPKPIEGKAVAFARLRQLEGKPFFANPGEEDISLDPQFRRLR